MSELTDNELIAEAQERVCQIQEDQNVQILTEFGWYSEGYLDGYKRGRQTNE